MSERLEPELKRLVAEARAEGERVDVMNITRRLSEGEAVRDFRAILNLVLQEVYRGGGKASWDPEQRPTAGPVPTVEYVRRPPLSREARQARDQQRARDAAEARLEAERSAAAVRENMIRLRNLRLARERRGPDGLSEPNT